MKRGDLPVHLHKISNVFILSSQSGNVFCIRSLVTSPATFLLQAFLCQLRKKVSVRTINANVEKKKKRETEWKKVICIGMTYLDFPLSLSPLFQDSRRSEGEEDVHLFSVGCTRLYMSLCQTVGWFVGRVKLMVPTEKLKLCREKMKEKKKTKEH